jgi:hypothetical protein
MYLLTEIGAGELHALTHRLGPVHSRQTLFGVT